MRLCDVGLCFRVGEAEAGFDGGADGFGIGTVGLEDAEHGLDIRLFVGKSHKSCHVAIGEHTLLVEHTQHRGVVAILEIGVELSSQPFVDGARVDFVHQVNHVLFQCADIGESLVDAFLHIVFHTVAHML